MDQLCQGFKRLLQVEDIDPLFLIPAFILDFLCIHPFMDGNGRMSRLLTLLLLYQSGYEVGRYISFEKLTETAKESYYATLQKSSQGWHESKHSLLPWTEYFFGIVIAAYRDLEQRTGNLMNARGSKSEMVLSAIASFMGEFSRRDLQEACPHVSIDMIRHILQEERANGRLESFGRGSQAKWKKR